MRARKFVLCIDDGDLASLQKGKVYERLSDKEAEALGQLRVIDESREDYLFLASMFEPVKISNSAQATLFANRVAEAST